MISAHARALLEKISSHARRLWFPFRLPGRNELDAASRRSPHAYNAMKRDHQNTIALFAAQKRFPPPTGPLLIGCRWIEEDRRRDPDNIVSGGRKLLLDALGPGRAGPKGWHGAKLLHCDGWHCIRMLVDVFDVGREPGVEVVIAEVQLQIPIAVPTVAPCSEVPL